MLAGKGKSHNHFIVVIIITLLYSACAIERPPDGGPRDDIPPQIIGIYPPNATKNFDKTEIKILFDEYVVLRNTSQQIIISPPIKKQPKYYVKKKYVIVEFQEDLAPDITYTINFGQSIQDFHEGNPIGNFTYVFATGNKIDSGQIAGRIKPTAELKELNDVKIQLYDNLSDTAFLKERPTFFARTEKDGSFIIKNIRPGKYNVMALKDVNANYLFDQPSEWIGFTTEPIEINDTTPINKLYLDIFQESPKELILFETKTPEYGTAQFIFNKPWDENDPMTYKTIPEDAVGKWTTSKTNDTIIFTAENELNPPQQFLFATTEFADTAEVDLFKEKGKRAKAKCTNLEKDKFNLIKLNAELIVQFNIPLEKADQKKIQILSAKDSTKNIPIDTVIIEKEKQNAIKIKTSQPLKQGERYHIKLAESAISYRYGITNKAMKYAIEKDKKENYGTLIVKVDSASKNDNLILEITNKEKHVVYYDRITEIKDNKLILKGLRQNTYAFRMIEDRNGNFKWDTGDYSLKQQAEKIKNFTKKIELKGNWEAEIELKFD